MNITYSLNPLMIFETIYMIMGLSTEVRIIVFYSCSKRLIKFMIFKPCWNNSKYRQRGIIGLSLHKVIIPICVRAKQSYTKRIINLGLYSLFFHFFSTYPVCDKILGPQNWFYFELFLFSLKIPFLVNTTRNRIIMKPRILQLFAYETFFGEQEHITHTQTHQQNLDLQ